MNNTRTLLVYPRDGAFEVQQSLEEAGCCVTVTHSATQALAKLALEPYDCVVSAYRLSGDDGLSLFEAICEIDDDMPFILFGDTERFDIEEAFNVGIDRFVRKNGSAPSGKLVDKIMEVTTGATDTPEKQDITGHEPQAEDIVRAIDEAPVGMTLTDPSLPDNPVVYINEAWEEVTGYSSEEVLGRNLRMLQGPETDSDSVRTLATAVEDETPVTVDLRNYRRDGTPFWNELTVAPIHDENGEITHYVGFQNDVTKRKEAQQLAAERAARLQEEKETLTRILGRVNGLLHDVTQILIERDERPIVAQRICDEIVEAEGYIASWIGSTNPTEKSISLDATAGLSDRQTTRISLDELPEAARQAVESDQIAVCSDGLCAMGNFGPESVGVRRFAVVPLVYDKQRYGLLGVYGDSPEVLDRREQQLFESMGKMIASRLNAIETTEILTADSVLEVRVAIKDNSFPLSRVAARLGVTVEYIGLTNGGEEQKYELFLTASDCEQLASISSLPFVEDVREISETGKACTFAVTVDSPGLFHDLADHGASVVQLTAEPERAVLELELPPNHGVRSIIEILERSYEGVDLRSQKKQKSRGQTSYEFSSQVKEKLTDRQRATLHAAHLNGYFEWPRPTDGNEIAETLDITRQTFHQHLRAAERKLIDTYVEFDSEGANERNREADVLRTW